MAPRLEVLEIPAVGDPRPHPLLFVHGAWHGAWCWRPYFMPYFAARGYHCHAVSLRGHGESEGADRLRDTKLREYMYDIRRISDTLSAPPIVVAHSMGGIVVQKLLETWRPRAAVLVCPYHNGALVRRFVRRILPRSLPRFLLAVATRDPYLMVRNERLARALFFNRDIPKTTLRGWTTQLQSESFSVFMELFRGIEIHPDMVETPMLVVGAEHDALFAPSQLKLLATEYQADYRLLVGLAHNVMLDAKWEQAAECLLEWIQDREL